MDQCTVLLLLLTLLAYGSDSFRNLPKPTIGVVGEDWYELLVTKLKERGDESRAELIKLPQNSSISFFTEIQSNHDALQRLGIDIIIGRSTPTYFYAAGQLGLPFLATDVSLPLPTHNSDFFASKKFFFSLPIPDQTFAAALLDLLTFFKVDMATVIVDSSIAYSQFMSTMLAQKSIEIKLWTFSDKDVSNLARLPGLIDSVIEESRLIGCLDFVVQVRPSILKHVIQRAKHYGLLARPQRWYTASFVCPEPGIAAIRHLFSNISLISELCSESLLQQRPNLSERMILDKAIQMIRQLDWNLEPQLFFKAFKQGRQQNYNFDGTQMRFQFSIHTLNVEEETPGILKYVGAWFSNGGESQIKYSYEATEYIEALDIKPHFQVAAVEEHPHLIDRGNGTYEGFGVDLLRELSVLMNFSFSIGLCDSMGSMEYSNWTGVVGEIISQKADLSLGPLVHTREKEEVLDFTTSFKQREISLVMRKPLPSTTLFQFMGPFAYTVWICFWAAVGVVMMCTWVLESGHDKYFENPDQVRFNLKECSWFAVACAVMKQIDIFPKSEASRILQWTVYFFSVVMITSYTAKLAAFMTLKDYPFLVDSVTKLANLPPDSKIIFGTVPDSDIYEFFRDSKFPEYQKIYKLMRQNPSWMVNTTASGYKRALGSLYVFIWDDSVNQYEMFTEPQYECQLMTVGRPFGKRSLALGVLSGRRELREELDRGLLRLLDSGVVESLENKWWKSASICTESNKPKKATPLSINDVSGVFLILVGGFVAAWLWFAVKMLVHKRLQSQASANNKPHPRAEAGKSASLPLSPREPGSNGEARTIQTQSVC